MLKCWQDKQYLSASVARLPQNQQALLRKHARKKKLQRAHGKRLPTS